MRVGLFCNARNEKHIREWVIHHLLIGFDHIVIFDHLSSPTIISMFGNGFDMSKVTVIRVDQETLAPSVKMNLMNRAIQISKRFKFDWFSYIDADEFYLFNSPSLIPSNIKYIVDKCSPMMDSIAFNWLMFGSNNRVEDPDDLIFSSYLLSDLKLNPHTKALVRTSQAVEAINPHFYVIRSQRYGCLSGALESNHIFCNADLAFYQVPAYIGHYVHQSEETYHRRRINKLRDDGSPTILALPENFHLLHNTGNNYQAQKYVQPIKSQLALYQYTF